MLVLAIMVHMLMCAPMGPGSAMLPPAEGISHLLSRYYLATLNSYLAILARGSCAMMRCDIPMPAFGVAANRRDTDCPLAPHRR